MPTFIKTGFWENRTLPKQGYKGELNLDYLISTLVPAVTYAEVISALGYTPEDKSMSAYSMRVNNTNATANATQTTYRSPGIQTYTGSIAWTGTTAPSGATNHSYNWTQIGNLVTFISEVPIPRYNHYMTTVGACLRTLDNPLPIQSIANRSIA